jgi:hypothetical protein
MEQLTLESPFWLSLEIVLGGDGPHFLQLDVTKIWNINWNINKLFRQISVNPHVSYGTSTILPPWLIISSHGPWRLARMGYGT